MKYQKLCAKIFGNSAKDLYILRSNDNSRNILVNKSKENGFLLDFNVPGSLFILTL